MGGNGIIHLFLQGLPGCMKVIKRLFGRLPATLKENRTGPPIRAGRLPGLLTRSERIATEIRGGKIDFLSFASAFGNFERFAVHGQSRVQFGEMPFDRRMHAIVDLIDLRVIGDGFEGDVGDGLVDESAFQPLVRIFQVVIIIAGGHQPLLGQSCGHPGCVAGDPAPSPFFGDIGGGAGPAGGIEDQVTGIGGHEDATFNNLVKQFAQHRCSHQFRIVCFPVSISLIGGITGKSSQNLLYLRTFPIFQFDHSFSAFQIPCKVVFQ